MGARLGKPWLHVLVVGLALFFAVTQTAKAAENPNFYPSIIVLGAFLIPVVFVTWAYGRARPEDSSLARLGICFIWGGAVGIVVAGLLEYATLRDLGPASLLGVGVIEEGAKLIAPAFLYLRWRQRSERDGVLFGVASGMGFAAFETMGYGFVALLESGGSIGALEMTLFTRGLLSPAGHAAWTGLVCAVLWRERSRTGHAMPGFPVLTAFIGAVVLHALWDSFNSLTGATLIESVGVEVLSLVVAVVSLALLMRRFREIDRAGDEGNEGKHGGGGKPKDWRDQTGITAALAGAALLGGIGAHGGMGSAGGGGGFVGGGDSGGGGGGSW